MDIALQSSVYVSSPEYAGWLLKKGFHWRKLWRRRWVALHGAEIIYMKDEPKLGLTSMEITKATITAATKISEYDVEGYEYGFAIHINDGRTPTWFLRAESKPDKTKWLLRLTYTLAIVKWLEEFEKVKVLGVGGTAIVYELLHKTNGKRYAMKEMEIKNKLQMQMAVSEAEMLKDIMENISHPNIMHIEKVFQVGSKFFLVFPLCEGGELYEHIVNRGHFTERDAAQLLRDLISGLQQLHHHDILHLDIKPENLLFDSPDPARAKIMITDFGLSRLHPISVGQSVRSGGVAVSDNSSKVDKNGVKNVGSGVIYAAVDGVEDPNEDGKNSGETVATSCSSHSRSNGADEEDESSVLIRTAVASPTDTSFSNHAGLFQQKMQDFITTGVLELNKEQLKGTVGYMSPELILTDKSCKATDVFAAGVVLYVLLSGRPPFMSSNSSSSREILENTVRGRYPLSGSCWRDVSREAKELLQRMLCVHPDDRITTEEILAHSWITRHCSGTANAAIANANSATTNNAATTSSGNVVSGVISPIGVSVGGEEQKRAGNNGNSNAAVVDSSALENAAENSFSSNEDSNISKDEDSDINKSAEKKQIASNNNDANNSNDKATDDVFVAEGDSAVLSMLLDSPVNLKAALRRLSGHVQRRQSERFASTFTRLATALQSESVSGSLSDMYLASKDPGEADNTESNGGWADCRFAFAQALFALLADFEASKASPDDDQHYSFTTHGEVNNNMENNRDMDAIRDDVSSTNNSASNSYNITNSGNVAVINLVRPVRLEQLLTFLRLLGQSGSLGWQAKGSFDSICMLFCGFIDRDGDGLLSPEDLVTASVLVSQRSEAFLSVLFRIYSESVWYPGRTINHLRTVRNSFRVKDSDSSQCTGGGILDTQTHDIVEPPKYITGKHISAIFDQFGYSASDGQLVFDSLMRILQANSISQLDADSDSPVVSAKEGTTTEDMRNSESGSDNSNVTNQVNLLNSAQNTSSKPASTAAVLPRMDFAMFKAAVELDDVFVQVIFRRPIRAMQQLVKKIESNITVSSELTSKSSNSDYATLIKHELESLLKSKCTEKDINTPKKSFPIAKAIGRATMSAATNLVQSISQHQQRNTSNVIDTHIIDDVCKNDNNKGSESSSKDIYT